MTTSLKDQLLTKIGDGSAVVGVVGLGYVGLPLAIEFAKAGFRVIGYDVSPRVIATLSAGRSHIQDIPHADVAALVASGKLQVSADATRLAEVDAVSIAVPTPLVKTRDPDMSFVDKATSDAYVAHLRRDLEDGTWDARHGHLRSQPTYEGALQLFISRG